MEQLSLEATSHKHQPWMGEVAARPLATRYRPRLNSAVVAARVAPEEETSTEVGNVTEIILPQSQVENFQLLLPMLTQLNQEERWLAWVDPPASLVQKWQQHHGIVPGQLLVLRSSEQHDALDMAERALAAGTCHAVVLWSGKLSRSAHGRLEQASARGNSHGVVLRTR